MWTGFPAQVSSYRPVSKTNWPNWTLSEDICPAPANSGHFTSAQQIFVRVPTGNLQVLSIASQQTKPQDTLDAWEVGPTGSPRKSLEAP